MKVLWFIFSYVTSIFIILVVAAAIDTAGLVICSIFCDLKRFVPLFVLAVSALGTYLGVLCYCWLESLTPLHISSAMFALVVIVEYSNDSIRYRSARGFALLAGNGTPDNRLNLAIAKAKATGHAVGFLVAGLAHLQGSPAF